MAYGLKYYKELTQPNGKVVRLEILEKGYEGASKEIGPVCQALRLDIQGDTEIDAPIVKTSLSMTFVDAPDRADAGTKKCGNWDEFYTSDATLWRVVLKARNAQETAFATIWGGYITPDSYTEVLQYRGSVTLVARDNIGHLSDFPFDAEGNADGMISLIELIRGAWDKIESPMTLDDQAVANADWMLSDGVYAYDTYMNVSAFEDMNWYDALESALYAYGLVLRYTGNNNVSFYSLRNLPRMGAHEVEDISFIEPTFMSGAERELTPAVKRIEEAVEYEIVEQKAAPLIESVTFTGASSTIPFESKNIFGEKEWKNIPTWPIDNTTNEGWGNDKSKTLFFSPKAYGNNSFGNELYIATNTDGSGSVWYGQHIQGKSFAFTLSFGQLIERIGSGGITPIYLLPITVKKVNVVISASANGVTSYLNAGGSWQTSEAVLSLDIDEEARTATKDIALGAFSLDESLVKITIKNITLGAKSGEEWWDTSTGLGIYVAINALTFTNSNGEPLCETNRVNTNYDAKNNIILSRDPKIAPALNDVLFPSIIKNGIFVKEGRTYNPAKTWYWGGQTPQQMAVYNHLQLLCYHAKPNNILRGTIVNADVTDMQVIWMWHGAEHMLVSGTLDLISGYIENAVLREFARYEDMWGMLEPADMPEVEGKSSTNVEGGVAASNEGARMTSTTTVNIGGGGGSIVLDTFMSDTSQNGVQNRVIKAYVDGLGDDITKAYNAAISALNSEITNALSGKVDNVTFNSLSTQVATNKTDIATNKTNIGKLDTRLTTAEGEIDTLQTYTNWLDSVKGLIYKEGDNIKINTSLIVVGDTSSGGSGQDTPASGTVTGIKVSSTQTLTPNSAGIIDMVSTLASIDVSDQLKDYAKLTDIPSLDGYAKLTDIPATMAWTAITGKPSFASVATSGSYNDLSNKPTIPTKTSQIAEETNLYFTNARAVSALADTLKDYVTKTALASDLLEYASKDWVNEKGYITGITKTMVDSVLGSTTAGNANRFLMSTGSTSVWAAISKDMVTNALGYTPLSTGGGTLDGSLTFADYLYISNNRGIYAKGNNGVAYPMARITSDNTLLYGDGYLTMGIGGYNIYLQYGYNRTNGMLLNENGNVTIGDSDLAGTGYRFRVGGRTYLEAYNGNDTFVRIGASNAFGLHVETRGNGNTYFQSQRFDATTAYYNIVLQELGGNVLIGTTTDSGYKLDVAGTAKVNGLRTSAISIECDASGNTSGYGGEINRLGGGQLWIQAREGGLQLGNAASTTNFNGAVTMSSTLSVGGNTTINGIVTLPVNYQIQWGTTGYMIYGTTGRIQVDAPLSVSGNTEINGNLVVSGDTSSGSDIRFKDVIKNKTIKIEHIAKAPLFTFKWNDRDDDAIHLGSSAQYWEKVTPWLVKGEDFKTLDYSTLGVAMGISLAKKAVNHEERIKVLERKVKSLEEENRRLRYGN